MTEHKFNVRIYIYTPDGEEINIPINNCKINRYLDIRANKPYFIWRLASVELNKKWRNITEQISNRPELYAEILRGFFAGEGNIKTGSHSNRTIRIAQGKPFKLLEQILSRFRIEFRYRSSDRSYYIHGKSNWDICINLRIADLHPIKKSKFLSVYNTFKENHYKKHYLLNNIFYKLKQPHTALQLSKIFLRTQARVSEVLIDLKKLGLAETFRIGSTNYWVRKDQNIIIVSPIRHKYLKYLRKFKRTSQEIAHKFKTDHNYPSKILYAMEKRGLVNRDKDKNWQIVQTNKKLIVKWY